MNEKYLQDLYGWIKGKDDSYESRYSYDQFKQKMQDPEYATSMHGWISTKDASFSERRPLDTFIQQVKVGQEEQPVREVASKKKFSSESAIPQQLQKADTTELSSEDGSSVTPPTKEKRIDLGFQNVPTDMSGRPTVSAKAKPALGKIAKNKEQGIAPKKIEENKTYSENLGTTLMAGLNDVNKMITSIPETVYNVFSIPQNAIAYATGLDISTDSDKFKKGVGITNPILDYYKEEGKKLEKEITNFNEKNYESSSISENLKNGNYQDAFELLGSGIVRSAPTSIAIMAGGATLSTAELATASTAAFYDQNLEQVKEENPNASDIENNIKALGMSAAESVFSSIGTGQIGAVYKDIIKREGAEVGAKVFKDGLVQMYKGALEKYGVPIGLLGEGLEETATQITQNMINGKPAFEGAADAFILGGGSGVMFTAPISLKNAKDRIKNKVTEVDNKRKINKILEGGEESFSKVFDVSKDSEINEKQLSIVSLEKSRDLLVKDLTADVKKGNITEDQAKQSLYVFDKTQQITGQLSDIDIDNKSKVKVANLLKERESLSEKIQGKDNSLSVLERKRIDEINSEIEETILSPKEFEPIEIPNEIKNLNDDEVKIFTVENIEEIPEQFRDRAEKREGMEVKSRKSILGIPIGPETTKIIGEGYNYSLTGKEIKDYAIQEQTTNESVLRAGQPELGLPKVGEGNAKPEGLTEEETITTPQPQKVEIPDWHKEEYDERLTRYNELISTAKRYIGEEKSKNFLLRSRSEIKYYEEQIKAYEDKVKLLQENPVEFYKQELKEQKEFHEQRLNDDSTYKQDLIDDVGTTDFDVAYYNYIEDTNRKISDYETVQKTAKENAKIVEAPKETPTDTKEPVEVAPAEVQPTAPAEVQPGVEELFKSNPELAKIGTPKQYSDYLNSIFPKSKIKDIIYRGLNSAFGTTTLFKEGTNEKGEGIYFTTNKEYALRYGNELTAAIVNIENPKTTQYDSSKLSDKDEATRMEAIDSFQENIGFQKKEDNEGFDGIEGRDTKGTNDEIAVFDKSQIHLLGTDEDVQSFKDFVESTSTDTAPEEFGTQGLSEAELKGYNRMMTEVEDIVKKTKARLSRESVTDAVKKKRLLDAVMGYVTGSKVYENASNVQQERLVRDVRKRFGFSERSAPSVGKLFGTLKDVNKITMTEKAALVKQIRDLGRGARDAVKAWRLASQQLSKDIKELRALGKITTNQAANVMRAFSKVNVFSQKSVDRFTTYMTKVFEKADYADKLKTAKETRSKIKKLAKNKDKNANLRDLASKFGKIEPSLVEDIDAYNELATQIKNATDGSKIRGQKVNFAETVNIANATDYVTKQIESQDKIFREERIAELEELYGVDGIGFTDEEIKALLESDNPIPKENRDAIMATIKKAFDIYSTLIKDSISNKVDAFTGEDVSFTKAETDIINKFMSMDLNKIEEKNALQAVDALANFIENKSTAKMAATVATYTGDVNAEEVVKKGIYAVPLKKIWSPQFGSFLAEQTTTLPMVFEKMFKGFNRGGAVMDAMGLTKLINRKSFAERQANNIVADYVKQFYNTKANGEAFNTAYNNTERGMSAFMLRNVIGTEQEMKAEFNRRKGLIEQSIDALSQGNQQQKKQAELYQKAYDKVVLDSENLQDIKDKTDPKNLDAIEYWHKQWDSKFDQLSDVASGIYNKILKKDLNYSPDKYSKIKQKAEVDLINNNESAFIANTNGVLYNKKTGVLMDVTNSSKLPLDSKNKPSSFIDLSFDKNNSNSMYDALVDIETAEPIRQVQAFLNSDSYSKIIPDTENAEMLAKRIDTYVRNIRKKSPFTNDEFSKTIKKLNKIATLGVGQALGGVTQPIKQVIPVALNTLVNGQGLAVGASFNADFVKWLNESGYAIANRGVQSQADIETLNTLIEEASNSTGKKLLDKIEEANAFMLRWFLEKPDVFIAKASWKTYYEKSLKQQGKYDGKIDYSKHPINEEAANYAQRMVDRQQNISDHDLAGNLFTDRSPKAQVLAKIFMPFASFRMNQAARLATDLSVLGHWSVSTKEDKKVALLSLASFATEMAVFKALSAGIGITLGYAAMAWMDKEETEEEEDKRIQSILKGQATGALTDIVSPIPVFDKILQTGASKLLEGVKEGLEITDQDKLALYSAKPEDWFKNIGLYGMAPDKLIEFGKLISLAVTGKYTDDFGKEKTISDEDKKTLSVMIGPALLTNIGLAPSEVSGVIRNSIKAAKKKGDTPEEIQERKEKINMFQEELDKAVTPEDIEFASEALDRVKNPKKYESEKETFKAMKKSLLTNEETGITYDNISDVKKYDRPLWDKNFGPESEWYQATKSKRETEKFIKQKQKEAEEEKYGYVKPSRKSKNSDGTYKRYSSSSRRGFGGSSSTSSSTSERYDSRGVKITTTTTKRRGFN